MKINSQIREYLTAQSESKRQDMEVLHQLILKVKPSAKLWFLDGKNEENKTVSNPNIGYGLQTMHYANGTSREFYRVGLSANTSGISIYILGFEDKKYLSATYSKKLGRASVTGYCIKFKKLEDIHVDVLMEAIKAGFELPDK